MKKSNEIEETGNRKIYRKMMKYQLSLTMLSWVMITGQLKLNWCSELTRDVEKPLLYLHVVKAHKTILGVSGHPHMRYPSLI